MSHSLERIVSFAPWVTHGVELCAFIVHKMQHVALYKERITSFASSQ